MKRLAGMMMLAMMATGCGSSADHEVDGASDLHFITFGPGVSGLVAKVKKPQLAVCLSGVSEGDRKLWSDEVKSVVMKWISPLRAQTSDNLTQGVSVVRAGEACDADVIARPGTHANTFIGQRPTVNMDVNGYFASYNVLLHEFGHAFALSDTYQGGQSGNCVPGQPQAVMCNTSFSDLQRDDVSGVVKVFKQTFPNDRPGDKPTVDPDAEIAKMKLAMALGEEVSGDTYKLALGLLGTELKGATAEVCLGSLGACKASESGWRAMTRVAKKGEAIILQDQQGTLVQSGLSVTMRYKDAGGLAAYQSFNLASAGFP